MIKENPKPQKIKIVFIAPNIPWAHKILQNLRESEKNKYRSISLPTLARSISQKILNLQILLEKINEEMEILNVELIERKREIENCKKNDTAFSPAEKDRIILILSYTEASISISKVICELLHKYSKNFYKYILEKDESILKRDMKEKGINFDWIVDLKNIRNDLLHNYSAWMFFQETNNSYTFGLELPKNMKGKKWKRDSVTIEDINNFLRNLDGSYSKLTNLLVEKTINRK